VIPNDAQIASVFALGVDTGFARRADLIAWADREIEARAEPPGWIIELAMSHKTLTLDLCEMLRGRADCVTPDVAVQLAFALVPEPPAGDLATSKRMAREMYGVARVATGGAYEHPLLYDLMWLDDEFDLLEYSSRTAEQLMRKFADYIRGFRDDEVRARLAPVAWVGDVRI
jgi:hypothetical protein